MQEQWFESWFDSPWYPILYSHRDYAEAEEFISNLLRKFAPPANARFLDLACGRGRHARYINAQGFDVTGLDLSAASIADAKAFENEHLRFSVHDMRVPIQGQFDFIFNLFTSFGYFADREDNLSVLRNVAASMTDDGYFVLDFFNLNYVLDSLVPYQELEKEGIHFTIGRSYTDGWIVKTIDLVDGDEKHHFEERVQGLDLHAFDALFAASGLRIERLWGDYQGRSYESYDTPRMIMFVRKVPVYMQASL